MLIPGHDFDPYSARFCQMANPCGRCDAFWSIGKALEQPGGRFGRSESAHARGWSTLGRSDSAILNKMMDSDCPNVLHPRVWALSDRPNRPPGGSRAFQRLQKASHLPHGFAIWQDQAPYGSKSCPGLGMGNSFQNAAVAKAKCRFWRLRGPKPPWMIVIFPRKY